MSHKIEAKNYEPPRMGLFLLQFLIALLFVVFCARYWYLQIHRGEEFARLALENRTKIARVDAARGEIFDKNGIPLAENYITFAIAIIREDTPDVDAALAQISEWTNTSYEELVQHYTESRYLSRSFDPIIVVSDLPFEMIAPLQSQLHLWQGVHIVPKARRHYPQKNTVAHIMGYVAEATQEELKKDEALSLGDIVGRQGLELVLEDKLRGKKGIAAMEVDVFGRSLQRKELDTSYSGQNIYLSIDIELQKQIEHIMQNNAGSVIVMNPDTGALEALVTLPSYDNNLFVTGFSKKEWDAVRNHPRFPLQNRTIQSVFPPASVWKLLMAAALLERGVNPKDTVFCSGVFRLGNSQFRCWSKYGHGYVDLKHSIMYSCDVYYYEKALELGIDYIADFAKKCGFGRRTGIELPHEARGVMPDREWKIKTFNERWQNGDTVNLSIGQGYMLVTPVQLAVYISSLLNGGKLLKPQLIKGAEPEIVGYTPISQEHCKMIVDYMFATANEPRGTARIIKTEGVITGGKTGTAQVVKVKMQGDRRKKNYEMDFKERDHAWLGAFAEKDGRRYVIITMLEHGGGGSSAAGPVTRDIIKLLFPAEKKQ